MSLRLDDIGYTYAPGTRFAHEAVRGASLEVAVGELVLVVGATGSGKSTLLRIGAGLLEPSSGSATIEEAPFSRDNTRGEVGLIFQDAEAQLFADTVLDDVAFGPHNLGHDRATAQQHAREALTAVGLDSERYGSRSPFTLSGGEARRAAIAGVLAMRPRYLLADEPTSGLDAPGRAGLHSLLLEARKTAGIVVVSHAAEEFLAAADRVLVLADGASAWYGDARDLIGDPQILADHGLIPPDVLEVQRIVALGGAAAGEFTLDPDGAARNLATAGGWL